mmetsp:Transcript_19853/g.21294  ORF Transcript_19853/g.21294 Transcript_19853/m.21294 type:complete len:362 (-) Transcript_19853:111-1196(-)
MNHYDTLGVSRHATNKEIREAYRELAKALHPDKNQFGTELMKRVNEAYRILSDRSDSHQYNLTNKQHHETSPNKNKNKARTPPTSPKNSTEQKRQETPTRWEEEFVMAITCIICHEIVDRDFYEAPCCAALHCATCCANGQQRHKFRCQNKACRIPRSTPLTTNKTNSRAPSWAKSNKFMNIQIDKLTTMCVCGKRIYKNKTEAMEKHKLICPQLNTSCIKCSGQGNYTSVEGSNIKCDACQGRKFLPGFDWMDCFKCKGRGAYECVDKTVQDCTTCQQKGALQGKWTMCFKCQGVGAHQTEEGWIDCSACHSQGALRGFNLLECSVCKGCGCLACNHKGCLPCLCGSLCKGHSTQYTQQE